MVTDASKYIEYVYEVVSETTGASAWRTWSSAIFEEGSTAQTGLTKLTCGHLYVIVLRDDGAGNISKIDIPEAIAVDGGDAGLKQLDGKDLQILPNNVTEGDAILIQNLNQNSKFAWMKLGKSTLM